MMLSTVANRPRLASAVAANLFRISSSSRNYRTTEEINQNAPRILLRPIAGLAYISNAATRGPHASAFFSQPAMFLLFLFNQSGACQFRFLIAKLICLIATFPLSHLQNEGPKIENEPAAGLARRSAFPFANCCIPMVAALTTCRRIP